MVPRRQRSGALLGGAEEVVVFGSVELGEEAVDVGRMVRAGVGEEDVDEFRGDFVAVGVVEEDGWGVDVIDGVIVGHVLVGQDLGSTRV